MNDATIAALSPETVLQHMKQAGVTDVVWLPDRWDPLESTCRHASLSIL